MLQKIKKYLMNAGLETADLKKVTQPVAQSNLECLRMFSAIGFSFYALAIVAAFTSRLPAMTEKFQGYIIGFAFCFGIWVFSKTLAKRHIGTVKPLIIVFEGLLLATGLFISFTSAPDRLTITLLIIYMVAPILFTERPYHFIISIVIAEILFITLASSFKSESILQLEIVNNVIFSLLGMTIGTYMMKVKYERFLFENRVVELNDNQQLTQYLQSIADIYISMHYADIKTDTFMEIRSNSYIDKAIDNRHEDFSRQVNLAMKNTVQEEWLPGVLDFVNLTTMAERLRGRRTITHEFMGRNFGWCRARVIAVGKVTEDSEPRYIIFAVENINEQKKREKELKIIAETEGMTGLYNRESGIMKIKEAMSNGHHGMLCLFDIDKFKSVNDTFGHQAGDDVIKAVADSMRKVFRDQDILLRLGGDEFMVYVNKVTSEEVGTQIFSRLFTELSKKKFDWSEDYSISISLGATFFAEENDKMLFEDLYKCVDNCTYQSKKIAGRSFTFWRG